LPSRLKRSLERSEGSSGYRVEQKARERRDLDVVLLSANSLETIKLTHSSYFEPMSLDEPLPT
jgi:hypothetical protein